MKKKKTFIAAIVLLLVFVVGGAIAYFTDTDSKTNTFTIGNVDIDLKEPEWEFAITNSPTNTNNNDLPDAAEDMMPGESVAKDPTIRNLSTKNPAYVFAKVVVPCTTATAPATPVEMFTYTTNTGWAEVSSAAVACTSGGNATHVYYYGSNDTLTPLAKATDSEHPTSTSTALFSTITLLSTLKAEDIPNIDQAKNVAITAYGIQTEGLGSNTTPAAVWALFPTTP